MAKKKMVLQTAFGRYELADQLGEGGSGVVYRATDDAGKNYAVKIVKVGLTDDRRRRFKNELLYCSRESHPNIIRVLDWGVAEGDLPFYVMPYYPSTLRKLMNAGLPPDAALSAFTRLLDGIEAAHLAGVTHRDLKPENILCTERLQEIVIADFGVARFEQEELYTAVETKHSDRLANFRYAAPEQRERGSAVDHRADIFALGLIGNELYTRQVIQGAGYRRVSDAHPAFAYLDGIIDLMAHQNFQSRPNTVREIKEALMRAGVEAVGLQRLSELSKTVVLDDAIESRHFEEPISLEGASWDNGQLHLTLSYPPERQWIQAFHSIGNFAAVMGKGPARWAFQGKVAMIDAQEHDAQQCINHFKTYLRSADAGLREGLRRAAEKRKVELEQRLKHEREAQETRMRVNSNLKI
jgi:serine/threonine protein kinase